MRAAMLQDKKKGSHCGLSMAFVNLLAKQQTNSHVSMFVRIIAGHHE